jgi:hypothetical protein
VFSDEFKATIRKRLFFTATPHPFAVTRDGLTVQMRPNEDDGAPGHCGFTVARYSAGQAVEDVVCRPIRLLTLLVPEQPGAAGAGAGLRDRRAGGTSSWCDDDTDIGSCSASEAEFEDDDDDDEEGQHADSTRTARHRTAQSFCSRRWRVPCAIFTTRSARILSFHAFASAAGRDAAVALATPANVARLRELLAGWDPAYAGMPLRIEVRRARACVCVSTHLFACSRAWPLTNYHYPACRGHTCARPVQCASTVADGLDARQGGPAA